ncbi:predicted protein [Histoplasma capsulatum var. duboisii H88]|uniref:Predicted protein n=1 Tax=Ajellomyces capsulatus (strain H88) TaxID=544711 RepID=F0UGR1_AJEC8|nr:predicted protein [Histoplasma capsulatum var. duboisii H88]
MKEEDGWKYHALVIRSINPTQKGSRSGFTQAVRRKTRKSLFPTARFAAVLLETAQVSETMHQQRKNVVDIGGETSAADEIQVSASNGECNTGDWLSRFGCNPCVWNEDLRLQPPLTG